MRSLFLTFSNNFIWKCLSLPFSPSSWRVGRHSHLLRPGMCSPLVWRKRIIEVAFPTSFPQLQPHWSGRLRCQFAATANPLSGTLLAASSDEGRVDECLRSNQSMVAEQTSKGGSPSQGEMCICREHSQSPCGSLATGSWAGKKQVGKARA